MELRESGIGVISEENEEMLGSYAMIDPTGRAYTNLAGRYLYSRQPIHKVGFETSWDEVACGFDNGIFNSRGGDWEWGAAQSGLQLPIIQESQGSGC